MSGLLFSLARESRVMSGLLFSLAIEVWVMRGLLFSKWQKGPKPILKLKYKNKIA